MNEPDRNCVESAPRSEADEPCHGGFALSEYVAVEAALGEGFELAPVLAREGWSESQWDKARAAWEEAIVASIAGDLALFQRHNLALAEAWGRYRRPLPPLDQDFELWVVFSQRWMAEADSNQWLAEQGLCLGDVFSLQQRWSQAMAMDPTLAERQAKVLEAGSRQLPPLTFPPRQLPPPIRRRPLGDPELPRVDQRVEPVRVEPVRVEPVRVEPPRVEPVRVEPVPFAHALQLPIPPRVGQQTILHYGLPLPGMAPAGPLQAGISQDGTALPGAGRGAPNRAVSAQSGAAQEPATRADVASASTPQASLPQTPFLGIPADVVSPDAEPERASSLQSDDFILVEPASVPGAAAFGSSTRTVLGIGAPRPASAPVPVVAPSQAATLPSAGAPEQPPPPRGSSLPPLPWERGRSGAGAPSYPAEPAQVAAPSYPGEPAQAAAPSYPAEPAQVAAPSFPAEPAQVVAPVSSGTSLAPAHLPAVSLGVASGPLPAVSPGFTPGSLPAAVPGFAGTPQDGLGLPARSGARSFLPLESAVSRSPVAATARSALPLGSPSWAGPLPPVQVPLAPVHRLTLVDFSSLSAELEVFPEHQDRVLAKYGLSSELWDDEREQWQREIGDSPLTAREHSSQLTRFREHWRGVAAWQKV